MSIPKVGTLPTRYLDARGSPHHSPLFNSVTNPSYPILPLRSSTSSQERYIPIFQPSNPRFPAMQFNLQLLLGAALMLVFVNAAPIAGTGKTIPSHCECRN